MRRVNYIENFMQDVRYGVRQLRRNPGFTAVAILALALGIGASTTIFSVVNPVLIHGLPYPHAERLVVVGQANKEFPPGTLWTTVAPSQFVALRQDKHVFEDMAAVFDHSVNFTGAGQPERLEAERITANFFPLLGVEPALGRSLLEHEEDVAVLTHSFWQRRFASDPKVIGRTLTLDRQPYMVIGVLPSEFRYFPEVDVFLPNPFASVSADSSDFALYVIARLKPEITIAQAEAESTAISNRLGLDYWVRQKELAWHARVVPLSKELGRDVRPQLMMLVYAVSFVLLIACVTVASLLLARGAARQREMAVRTAMGANRLRLARQTLTESVLLASVGGTAGLVMSYWGIQALLIARPDKLYKMPHLPVAPEQIHIDWQVLAFTLGLSIVTGLLFGLAPAVFASRTNLSECLKDSGSAATMGLGRRRALSLLVIGELAASVVLLAGATLMIRSLIRALSESPGFDVTKVLRFGLSLPTERYAVDAGFMAAPTHEKLLMVTPQVDVFTHELTQRLKTIPGVESAAAWSWYYIAPQLRLEREPATLLQQPYNSQYVSPGFFRTMGIPILKGRDFTDQDTEGAPAVAIINEEMATDFWAGQQLIGRRLISQERDWTTGKTFEKAIEIVGITASARILAGEGLVQEVYFPYAQWEGKMPEYMAQYRLDMNFVVRTSSDPGAFVASVQKAVWDSDKFQPINNIKTMEDDFWSSLHQMRFYMQLLVAFAGLGLCLAMVSVYGVVSYSVARRTHEIGIRTTLGASPGEVVWLMVQHGLTLTLIAVPIGIVGALALTRFLSSLLYGVKPTDPLTFIAVPLILIAIALVASYIPARRATKVDPMVALRYE